MPSTRTTTAPDTTPNPSTRGYLVALVASLFLSTTAIFIRHLVNEYALPALVLAVWRAAFVTLTLAVGLRVVAPHLLRIERRHVRYLALYGVVLALFNSLWTLSVAENGAAVATVLVYSSGAFTALLGRWLLQETLDSPKLLAVVLSFSGCALIAGALDPAAWDTNAAGILIGVASGLSYAVYSLMGRSASQRGLNPWTTLLYTFGGGTLVLLVANLLPSGVLPETAAGVRDLFWLGDALEGWGVLFLLAAIPTLAGYGLYLVSLSHLPSSVANLILTLEPAFTAVIAYATLGERFTTTEFVGSVLIMGGVVLLRTTARQRARRLARGPVPGPAGD